MRKASAVILKNNVPRYLVVEFGLTESEQLAADEDVMAIYKRYAGDRFLPPHIVLYR